MKVLVTGASGFVGTVTSVEALRRGWQVLGCGRSEHAPLHLACSWQKWNDDAEAMARVVESFGPDLVFHAAGSASVAASFEAPEADWAASGGTLTTLLEAVRRSGVKPLIVFPSSAAVYGNPDQLPVPESDTLHPISPYGRHKVRCEELARQHRDVHGMHDVGNGSALAQLILVRLRREDQRSIKHIRIDGHGGIITSRSRRQAVISRR